MSDKTPRINPDWKRWKRDWPHNGDVEDPLYIMKRNEFFKENGNGWWITALGEPGSFYTKKKK